VAEIPNAESDLQREVAGLILRGTNICERAGRQPPEDEIIAHMRSWNFSDLRSVAHWCQNEPMHRGVPPQLLIKLLDLFGTSLFKVDDEVTTQHGELARIVTITPGEPRPYTYEIQNGLGLRFNSDGAGLKHRATAGDQVNHPAHYGGDSLYEAIKVMEAWHGPEPVYWFCLLSAEKYQSRMGKKPGEPMERDVKKAAWYMNYAAKLREKIESEKK